MRKALSNVLGYGAAIAFVLGLGAEAWAQWPADGARHLTRPKLWSSHRNHGGQGSRSIGGQGRNDATAALQYPGSDVASTGVDFREYWGNLGGWTPSMQRQNATSRGEGVWIISTRPGGSEIWSITGARRLESDIVMMLADPSADPTLADLGNPDLAPTVSGGRVTETSVHPSGTNKSNWWPGQTTPPVSDQPIEIHNHNWYQYMDDIVGRDNAAEEIIVGKWTTGNGITATKKAMGWGHPDFDDFFIVEFVFENTGDTNGDGVADTGLPVALNGTYFNFESAFKMSESFDVLAHHNQFYGDWNNQKHDDWWRWTEGTNYLSPGAAPAWTAGKPSMVGRNMIYQFDGDSPLIPIDDTGGPFRTNLTNLSCGTAQVIQGQLEDELLAYHVGGYAVLDYDPSDGYTNDTETYIAPRPGVLTDIRAMRQEYMNHQLSTNGWTYGQYRQQFFDEVSYNEAWDNSQPIQWATSNEELTNQSTFSSHMMFGPYDIAPGDKVKIVMAWVYASGVEEGIYQWARSGSQNLVAAQTDLMDDGVTNLERHLNHAQWLYDHGYDMPDQPPDVFTLVETNTEGGVDIKWSADGESSTHPDYTGAEANDIAGYRVYRSTGAWKGHLGPWTLLANVPKGTQPNSPEFRATLSGGVYTVTDLTAQAGFAYWYSVRAYANGHTSWTGDVVPNAAQGTFANLPPAVSASLGTGLSAANGSPESKTLLEFRPLLPGNTQADALALPVKVVPNPFKLDAVHAYGQSRNIRFTNIPRRSRVSIFSISGDLITEIIHDDITTTPPGVNNPAEVTWTQGSRSGLGSISPGMYFFVVESLDTGAKTDGTFMIVR